MTTITTWLTAAVAALVAGIGVWITGRRSGAKDNATANRAKEADAYETHLQEIADAAAARSAVCPDSMSDDKYRRD